MRLWHAPLLALLVSVSAVAETGLLCVAGAPCRTQGCGGPIEAASIPRPFTWSSREGAVYRLGIVDSGASALTCTDRSRFELQLVLPKERRPAGAKLLISRGSAESWQLDLPERQLRGRISVALPRGDYALTVEVPHCVRARTKVAVAEKPVNVSVALRPLPKLTGVVLARATKAPLPGALVRAGDSEAAIADLDGRFTVEADPESWPRELTVIAIGYAPRTVIVPPARMSAALEEVYVSRAGSIRASAQTAASSDARPVTIDLQRVDPGRVTGTPLHSRQLAPDAESWTAMFEELEPGRYLVLVRGSAPLEQSGELVELRDGEEAVVAVTITPLRLALRTRLGGETLPEAHLTLRNVDRFWQGKIATDAGGEAAVTLWQGGRTTAVIGGGTLTFPHLDRRTIDAARGEDEWTIDVPSTAIDGVVTDSETGAPLADARVSLKVTLPDRTDVSVRTVTDPAGRFRFVPAPPGVHLIKAIAKGYLPAESAYRFEQASSRSVALRLDAAEDGRITVIDHLGAAVAGARVVEVLGLQATNIYGVTDHTGVAQLPARKQQSSAWIIPRDGSFGVARLSRDAPAPIVRLSVAVSRIVLRAESESRVPIANVSVVMRYNGQLVPPAVVAELARVQGARPVSGSDGRIVFDHMPSGSYEFWPASTRELAGIAAGAGPRAPVRIVASPGENMAVLTFEEAPKP